MKCVINHSYEELVSVDNLLVAWEEFAQEKKKRADVQLFARSLLYHILNLHNDLTSFAYKHSSYERFCITDPKPRTINKASVRDRLLHRAMYRLLYPAFDKTFIHDSYSCRDNKGTHRAFQQLVRYSRKISHNYTAPCWAIKMDIRRFFENINHEILISLLRERVGDKRILNLLEEVIRSFECKSGRGMPLGNLTSQLFANIYMDPFDKFVKHKLKAKYYLRYADDFIVLSPDPHELIGYFLEMNRFLKEKLKLTIHPDKIYLRKLEWGIDFVGYVAFPHHSLPKRKTVKRILRKVDEGCRTESIQSYLGYLQHANAYILAESILNIAREECIKIVR